MEYITLQDLCNDIRNNFHKVPQDIMGVVGVPRSGMLPATILCEYLNVGLCTIDDLLKTNNVENLFNNHGGRKLRKNNSKKILVVNDTCYFGNELSRNKKQISEKYSNSGYEFIYLVVYMEGNGVKAKPDIFLRDVRDLAKKSEIGIVLYEWNLFANPGIISKSIFDLDGVMCLEPPDERKTEEYVKYIKNPTPLFIPTGEKITILTYRLEKYRKETEEFLKSVGLNNVSLNMFKADTYEQRGKTPSHVYKSEFYKNNPQYKLFIESSDFQARKINEITKKPVYCVETNKMYK